MAQVGGAGQAVDQFDQVDDELVATVDQLDDQFAQVDDQLVDPVDQVDDQLVATVDQLPVDQAEAQLDEVEDRLPATMDEGDAQLVTEVVGEDGDEVVDEVVAVDEVAAADDPDLALAMSSAEVVEEVAEEQPAEPTPARSHGKRHTKREAGSQRPTPPTLPTKLTARTPSRNRKLPTLPRPSEHRPGRSIAIGQGELSTGDEPTSSVGSSIEQSFEPVPFTDPGGDAPHARTDGEALEPATNLLPTFGAHREASDAAVKEQSLAGGADELAELALSVRDEEQVPERRFRRPGRRPGRRGGGDLPGTARGRGASRDGRR